MNDTPGACAPFVLLAILASAPGVAAAEPYAAATRCATCHQTIHLYWSESEHARAATKPSYLRALGAAVEGAADPNAVRRGCVWCHAPAALVTGDYDLLRPSSREGVSCDFCHTVADVDLSQPDHPFRVAPGRVKRGPLEYAKSPSHDTAFSTLHKASPLLCAACHEYRNAANVAVLSTYTEWKAGPYPERGQTCQECHMPLVPGEPVQHRGLASGQRRVNLHRITGGTIGRVRGGVVLRIDSVTVSGASADVQAVVTNEAVGHSAPGGLSSKSLVLLVGVETATGELLHVRERVYRRELLDASGRALAAVPDLFLKAASVGEDTRLKQKESRAERFTVPLPDNWKAIVARLEYRDGAEGTGAKSAVVAEERRERRP